MSRRLEIISDPATMTIRVGDVVFDSPRLVHLPERAWEYKETICPPEAGNDYSSKALHKHYADRLGPKFNRRFQAANYWLWIGNRMLPSTANMLRWGKKLWHVYSDNLVKRANDCLAYVTEAERDGLHHLIPAIVAFTAPPSVIRTAVGKGMWKRIAANSRTRNARILQHAQTAPSISERFVWLQQFPSGVLNGVQGLDPDAEALAARLTPWRNPLSFQHTAHIIRDARRMLGDLNPAWGLARIQREHDRAVMERRSRTFSNKPFAQPWAFERGGYKAELLTSKLAIAVEGDTQHHCVGSYASMAADGRYAVLRIEGPHRATAGLVITPQGWGVDQVYGACNAVVPDACRSFVIAAARHLASVTHRARAA